MSIFFVGQIGLVKFRFFETSSSTYDISKSLRMFIDLIGSRKTWVFLKKATQAMKT